MIGLTFSFYRFIMFPSWQQWGAQVPQVPVMQPVGYNNPYQSLVFQQPVQLPARPMFSQRAQQPMPLQTAMGQRFPPSLQQPQPPLPPPSVKPPAPPPEPLEPKVNALIFQ